MDEDLIEALLDKVDGEDLLLDGTEYDAHRTEDPFELALQAVDDDGEPTGPRYRALVSVELTEILPISDPPADAPAAGDPRAGTPSNEATPAPPRYATGGWIPPGALAVTWIHGQF